VLDQKEQQIQSLTLSLKGQDFILGDPTAQVAPLPTALHWAMPSSLQCYT
jgi:hypothetical protein